MNTDRSDAAVIGQLSWAGQRIEARLREMAVDEVVSYNELTRLVNLDVQGRGRHLLARACARLERDERMVFGPVRGVGVKRLADDAVVERAADLVPSIRRKSKRTARRLTCVEFEALPPALKTAHQLGLSLCAFLQHATRPKTVAKLEKNISQTQERLPLDKTLELFRS